MRIEPIITGEGSGAYFRNTSTTNSRAKALILRRRHFKIFSHSDLAPEVSCVPQGCQDIGGKRYGYFFSSRVKRKDSAMLDALVAAMVAPELRVFLNFRRMASGLAVHSKGLLVPAVTHHAHYP